MINFRINQGANNKSPYLNQFKAKGQRRLLATHPRQQQVYIDTRNLWKASTTSQEKQYESIRNSGLLSNKRRMTFLKFNYRQTEERNLCYPDVFKIITNKHEKQFKSLTKIKDYHMKDAINQLQSKTIQQFQKNNFVAEKDWLEEYHETQKIEQVPFKKMNQFSLGTMNVNDLWGQKLLQQCLGFLPCKRDRPKMLKFYSSKIKHRKMKQKLSQRCKTDYV